MRIISLQAENVKRLVAVEIQPSGNVVEITGRNGQGKSSLLDAIWWALGGQKAIQSDPIRHGADEARITLDLGELIVKRTFRKGADGPITSITVETTDGAKFSSPQKVLDALLGELSFDPLAFTRMKPADQFETLRKLVPGVDFDLFDRQHKADYDERTAVNRAANQLKVQAGAIKVPETTPLTPVDENALVQELATAAEHNAAIERERLDRRQRAESIASTRKAYEDDIVKAAEMRRQADILEHGARQALSGLAEEQAAYDALPPIPELIDVSETRRKIDEAKRLNAVIEQARRRQDLLKQAAAEEAKSAALTKRMEDRAAQKKAAIASAQMPVDGLGFGEGFVTLKDVPFEQASGAEQLRASIAIAAAMNPKLRVIRVRDGSLLDDDSWRLLAEEAQRLDFQVWVETVASGRPAAIVIEDGHVSSALAAAE